MTNLTARINHCRTKIDLLDQKLIELNKQLDNYLRMNYHLVSDKYLNERYPGAVIRHEIMNAEREKTLLKKKLVALYEERTWMGVEYFGPSDLHDIEDVINRDGYIIGIKL